MMRFIRHLFILAMLPIIAVTYLLVAILAEREWAEAWLTEQNAMLIDWMETGHFHSQGKQRQ